MANQKIREYKKLLKKKNRREAGLFIVEGRNMVNEARERGDIVDVLTTNPDEKGVLVAPFVFKRLTETESPQDIIAVVKIPKLKAVGDRVLALNNVQDPGNVGTLIRTAAAFGYTDVIVQGADVYSAKALRSSQGAIFGINVIQTKDVSQFFDGRQVLGAMLDKEATSYDKVNLEEKFMIVLGNEGHGIDKEVQKKLTEKVYIPIEFESLNVASAGAILMSKFKK